MLEVRLLGEQRVAADGEVLDVGRSTRMLGVLGYLIVHAGAPQLRQQVAGVFWPGSTDAQARTNLRRELHQLRGILPDADRCLAWDDNTVAWRDDAPCEVDLVEFQRAVSAAEAAKAGGDDAAFVKAAERAVRMYGGDLLPGFYDDWVLTERDRLCRSCVTLLDKLMNVVAEDGDLDASIEHARRRTELEPLEESGYRTLMSLQARAGDRAAALRTFHACSSVLERELGVEPSDETVTIYDGLLAGPPEPAEPSPSLRRTARLIGRDAELAALHTMWAQALEGPRMVVVAGEAGVGKTRVVTEFADAIERGGGTVVRSRCFASRGSLALAPVADWMRGPALGSALRQLDPVWLAEVARLVPEIGPGDGSPQPAPLTDAWQRSRFFEGLARGVLAAGGPILLVLDDLHWCDPQTLEWLELLLHLDGDAPLLVAATLRSEELGHNTAAVTCCRRLRAAGALQEVELAPLGADEVRELASELGAAALDDTAARRLHSQTGGFPLFVVELLRGGSTGWSRIEAVLAGRLAQLTPPADELSGLAAAVGCDFSPELLGAASGLDDDVVVDAIDQMWRRRLLREHSSATYDFTHDLLRDAAYEQLTSPHRRLVHRRIAAALEQLHADDLDLVAGLIADQHERGGQPERAIAHHVVAARAASAVFAHDDAVAHYERALDLLRHVPAGAARDRRELDLRDGMLPPALAMLGYSAPRVGASLERTIQLGERLGDDAVVVRAQVARASYLFVSGRIHDVAELTAWLVGRASKYPERTRQLSLARTWALISLGRLDAALERFDHLEEQADVTELTPLGFSVRVMVAAWRAHALWLKGRSRAAATSAGDAVDLADDLDHPFSRAVAQGYSAITHRLLDDVDGSAETAMEVRRLCDRYGFAYYGEWGRILEGWATGGAAGESLIRSGIERLRAQSAGARMPFWLALLGEALAAGGRTGEASRTFTEARTWAEDNGDLWWLSELWRLDAALQADAEAEPMLERALAVAGGHGAVALELRAATDLARRWIDAARPEQARGLLVPVRARADACNRGDVSAADDVLASIGS